MGSLRWKWIFKYRLESLGRTIAWSSVCRCGRCYTGHSICWTALNLTSCLISFARIHGVFVVLVLQTMQQPEAVGSTLLILGKQILMFCKESHLSGSSCSWRLYHVWYVVRGQLCTRLGRTWGLRMLFCSGIQFYLMPLSCIISENSWHTSKRGKCRDARASGLWPGRRIH